MLNQHAAPQGVPGHVYAHVLAHRIRSGRVSVDLSDGHLEPVKTAGASHSNSKSKPTPNPSCAVVSPPAVDAQARMTLHVVFLNHRETLSACSIPWSVICAVGRLSVAGLTIP